MKKVLEAQMKLPGQVTLKDEKWLLCDSLPINAQGLDAPGDRKAAVQRNSLAIEISSERKGSWSPICATSALNGANGRRSASYSFVQN